MNKLYDTLPDLVALRAIPLRHRYVGMEVTVLDTDGYGTKKKYTLVDGVTDADWQTGNVSVPTGATPIHASTTGRTLALSDAGKYVRMTNGSANTVTVPTNASVAFEVGTEVHVIQIGAGQTSFVAAGGVTINAAALAIQARYKAATLKKVGTNEWDLLGALA